MSESQSLCLKTEVKERLSYLVSDLESEYPHSQEDIIKCIRSSLDTDSYEKRIRVETVALLTTLQSELRFINPCGIIDIMVEALRTAGQVKD